MQCTYDAKRVCAALVEMFASEAARRAATTAADEGAAFVTSHTWSMFYLSSSSTSGNSNASCQQSKVREETHNMKLGKIRHKS
jgi:hypothetical protein